MAGPRAAARRPTAPKARRLPAWASSVPGPSDPLPDEIEQYLDWLRVQRNRPATTARAYRQDLAKFVAYMRTRPLGDSFCAGVDRAVLRRYQIELAEVLPNPRSRARALVALRRFLAYAYDEGWIAPELSRQVTVPRYVVGDPHPVPTPDVPRLLAALPRADLRDVRDRALVHLLITTGCRISEACALNRGDVRPEGFRVLGKGGKHRTVYCTEEAYAAVEDYLRMRGPDDSDALFISVARADLPHGRAHAANRLTPDGARRALAALRRRLGGDSTVFSVIRRLRSPHVARHTAATTLLEATDGDVRLVQEVLGHATLETLRVYTEITDRRKRAAYQRLGEYLQEVGGR
ncbi:MAG: tyrosine-type recombinase/integrase [Candidatus Dormibacteraeota bacterium]|nr:tyrosine-type recombinase/integrase [Candidatus Dormibacteraeota bacterium]MBV9524963.1 tyrosine-type recombinase/integrase [Candidatus Dormibacteraeota bacterium]